jgi:hypothetical protein
VALREKMLFLRKVFGMRKRWMWLVCVAVSTCVCAWAADWPSTGGNPQRDGWSRGEKELSKENLAAKKIKLLYKYKFDNKATGLQALTAPIDLSNLIGWKGFKELLFIGGSSDKMFSIDSDLGQEYFTTKLSSSTKPAEATVLCPGGLTANVVMPGSSAGGRAFGRGGIAVIWGVSSDGVLHTLRQQDGDASYIPTAQFAPANSKLTGLNTNRNVIYASSVDGCGGNPNGLYAAEFTPPVLPRMPGEPVVKPASFTVAKFMTNGSGFSGDGGTSISTDGETIFGQVAEGNGDLAGKYSDTVLAMDPKTLAPKDYFTPGGTLPALKKGVAAAGVTPMVFQWGGKDVLLVGGRDGRLYLLDAAALGGSDHHTPLAKTEPIVAPDTDFSGNGIWGTFSTYEDEASKTRWVYAAVHGQAAIKAPGSNGAASNGSIVAFKVVDQGGKPSLQPQWVSRDMISPAGTGTANGLVFALSTGESSRTAKKDGTPYTVAEMEKMAKSAVLYILDGTTGQELFAGSDATTFAHSGIAIANGRVYFSTHDNTLFAYGLPEIR